MPVTRPTASTLSSPSAASCARLDSSLVENVSTAAKLPATITAPSTPSQTGADDTRRPSAPVDAVLRSAASRMLTISPASRPSRRPIRKFGTASAQVTRIKVRQTSSILSSRGHRLEGQPGPPAQALVATARPVGQHRRTRP